MNRVVVVVATVLASLVLAEANQDDPDRIYFPESSPVATRSGSQQDNEPESELAESIRLAQWINSANSTDEFLNMIVGVPESVKIGLASRFGEGVERANGERPVLAKCNPEMKPVPFQDEERPDPSTIYVPVCTKIKRCGGCCSHPLLSCQPIETQTRNFEVMVTKVETGKGLVFKGKQLVPMEEHTKCMCDCIVKEKDCTERQVYNKKECRCVCNNKDEEAKCRRDHSIKLWNSNVCACVCRTADTECNTGYYFDHSTCRCREVPISRLWLGNTRGTGYRLGQTQKPDTPVFVSLDASDPRRKPKDDPEY